MIAFGEDNKVRRTAIVLLSVLVMVVSTSCDASEERPVRADSLPRDVNVEFGGIVYGYSDGYWDKTHSWHRWDNATQPARYKAERPGSYYNVRHNQELNDGWRGDDLRLVAPDR
jgi:hypothetical protein